MNPESMRATNDRNGGSTSICEQLLDGAALEYFRATGGIAVGRTVQRDQLAIVFALVDATPATVVVHPLLALDVARKLDRHLAERAFLRKLRGHPLGGTATARETPDPATTDPAPTDPNVAHRDADRWLARVTDPRIAAHPSVDPIDALLYVDAAVGHLGAEARDKTALVFTTSDDEASAKVMLFLVTDALAGVLSEELRFAASCLAAIDELEDELAER